VNGGKGRKAGPAAQLDAAYAQMPTVECKGLCQDGCGSVAMTPLEQQRILTRHGVSLPLVGAFAMNDPDARCPALVDGQCSVYADRPWICRAYGTIEDLTCQHGCKPATGWWPKDQVLRSLAQVKKISGS
jgi:Fe-S-cluster containining protein